MSSSTPEQREILKCQNRLKRFFHRIEVKKTTETTEAGRKKKNIEEEEEFECLVVLFHKKISIDVDRLKEIFECGQNISIFEIDASIVGGHPYVANLFRESRPWNDISKTTSAQNEWPSFIVYFKGEGQHGGISWRHVFTSSESGAVNLALRRALVNVLREYNMRLVRPTLQFTARAIKASTSSTTTDRFVSFVAALRRLRLNTEDRQTYLIAIKTLRTFVNNLIQKPNVAKYQSIRLSNAIFQKRLGKLSGGLDCMRAIGFKQTTKDGENYLTIRLKNDAPGDEAAISPDILRRMHKVLESACNAPCP